MALASNMNLAPNFDGGYDENGHWQRTKFCFISCGKRCTCRPPFGMWYSMAHDVKRQALDWSHPKKMDESYKRG